MACTSDEAPVDVATVAGHAAKVLATPRCQARTSELTLRNEAVN